MRVAHQGSVREEREGERDQIVANYYTEHLLTASQHFPMSV